MIYEELMIQNNHLNIQEMSLSEIDGLKGLYFDGNIAIEETLLNSKKNCILAEELGHYYTTSGNILDLSDTGNRKQELRARAWAYDKLIGLSGIISCFEAGCRNLYEMAEHLEVTEEFLKEAIERYRQKYGVYVSIKNYVIYFEPTVGVMKITDQSHYL